MRPAFYLSNSFNETSVVRDCVAGCAFHVTFSALTSCQLSLSFRHPRPFSPLITPPPSALGHLIALFDLYSALCRKLSSLSLVVAVLDVGKAAANVTAQPRHFHYNCLMVAGAFSGRLGDVDQSLHE